MQLLAATPVQNGFPPAGRQAGRHAGEREPNDGPKLGGGDDDGSEPRGRANGRMYFFSSQGREQLQMEFSPEKWAREGNSSGGGEMSSRLHETTLTHKLCLVSSDGAFLPALLSLPPCFE